MEKGKGLTNTIWKLNFLRLNWVSYVHTHTHTFTASLFLRDHDCDDNVHMCAVCVVDDTQPKPQYDAFYALIRGRRTMRV